MHLFCIWFCNIHILLCQYLFLIKMFRHSKQSTQMCHLSPISLIFNIVYMQTDIWKKACLMSGDYKLSSVSRRRSSSSKGDFRSGQHNVGFQSSSLEALRHVTHIDLQLPCRGWLYSCHCIKLQQC